MKGLSMARTISHTAATTTTRTTTSATTTIPTYVCGGVVAAARGNGMQRYQRRAPAAVAQYMMMMSSASTSASVASTSSSANRSGFLRTSSKRWATMSAVSVSAAQMGGSIKLNRDQYSILERRKAGISMRATTTGGSNADGKGDSSVRSSKGGKGFGYKDGAFKPVKESDTMRALSEIATKDGRNSTTNNLVLDGDMTFDQLDEKVNVYPQYRPFCAIGSGGDDFVTSIVQKAETALGKSIPQDKIIVRPSKEGKWVSVKIGPLYVEDKETVVAVYKEIHKEKRIRYCL